MGAKDWAISVACNPFIPAYGEEADREAALEAEALMCLRHVWLAKWVSKHPMPDAGVAPGLPDPTSRSMRHRVAVAQLEEHPAFWVTSVQFRPVAQIHPVRFAGFILSLWQQRPPRVPARGVFVSFSAAREERHLGAHIGGQMSVTLTDAEYERLLLASEADDTIVRCEVCGAWIGREEEACAVTEDFIGCWKAATRDPRHDHLCVSYRATA